MLACPGFIKTSVTINALTANGKPQGTMDDAQENGMLPQVFAEELMKAIVAKKDEVYIGGKETKGVWIKRFFPKQFNKLIRKAKVT
jgi:short-subunit dehydrogenase